MVKKLDTGRHLTAEDKSAIEIASEVIFDLDWGTTEQGSEYWYDVYNNMIKIANERATCESCGQKLPE